MTGQSPPSAITIDHHLVRKLVAAQFPQWANLAIWPVAQSGWDNRTFHLGDKMTVRLPSSPAYAGQVEKEQIWLPRLAHGLPFAIPEPLGWGEPGDIFPLPWSVYRWIEGEPASAARVGDMQAFAVQLADFLRSLAQAETQGAPLAGDHNFHRGGPPAYYGDQVDEAIRRLGDDIDRTVVSAIWLEAVDARWAGRPVWFHGDFAAGNLLLRDGRLHAVIDFGMSGAGDPACDLSVAYTLLDVDGRRAFRSALQADDAMWARGRGWALWKALIVLAGMAGTNPADKEKSRQTISAIINDFQTIRG